VCARAPPLAPAMPSATSELERGNSQRMDRAVCCRLDHERKFIAPSQQLTENQPGLLWPLLCRRLPPGPTSVIGDPG
jgi:hypothetical protein